MGKELQDYIHSISTRSLAEYLGIDERTIHNWYKRDRIPKYHIRGMIEWIEMNNDNGLGIGEKLFSKIKNK